MKRESFKENKENSKSMKMRCFVDMLSNKRVVRLKFKPRKLRPKQPEKKFSKSSKRRRRRDALKTNTLKT
jgi:hypothetical protein